MRKTGKLVWMLVCLTATAGLAQPGDEVAKLKQRVDQFEPQRQTLWKEKRFGEAAQIMSAFVQAPGFAELDADARLNTLYNLACAYARLGLKQQALDNLGKAEEAGDVDYYGMKSDPDLVPLHSDSRFKTHLETARSRMKDYLAILRKNQSYGSPGSDAPVGFVYQAADNPDLVELRKSYHLDKVAGTGDELSRIVSLMSWVHKMVRHDGSSQNPRPENALNLLKVCREENRGINCRMMATILNEAYLSMGFRSRHITCLPLDKEDSDCHVITAVYSRTMNKWLYMDPTWEAWFMDEKGTPMSIEEVRAGLIAGRPITPCDGINWNGDATAKDSYVYYMTKNLFQLQCPLVSAFGYESRSDGTKSWVELDPAGVPPNQDQSMILHDPCAFWQNPYVVDPHVLTDFDFVVERTSQDYAGYHDKTAREEERAKLRRLTEELRAHAAGANDIEPVELMNRWLAFFRDSNLTVSPSDHQVTTQSSPTAEAPTDAERELASRGPKLDWTEDLIRHHAAASDDGVDPVEGVWEVVGGPYRVGIMAKPSQSGTFSGVVLRTGAATWSPGQIKCELTKSPKGGYEGRYFMFDHSEKATTAHLAGHGTTLILPDADVELRRICPDLDASAQCADRASPQAELFIKKLSPRTLWLRVPDFSSENRAALDKLLTENQSLIESTPNLVIDLRDNRGESDPSCDSLLPWLYTHPVYEPGVEFLSSPRNIEALEGLLAEGGLSPDERQRVQEIVGRMEAHPGTFVLGDPRGVTVHTYPEVRPNPKHVGIIITGASGGGEQFLLAARQSRRVTLFGGRSAGAVDYTHIIETHLPSGRYSLHYPISRSLRLPAEPIDNVGIAPDIKIDTGVDDPIGFVESWLERQVD